MSKYSAIMDLDAELKRRNDEIFRVERERSNLEIELSECSGVFKQKRRKELQEQISILDGKAEKMKAELSRMIQDAGYANASEFYTELFRFVRRNESMMRLVRNGSRSVLRLRLKPRGTVLERTK